MLRQVLGSLGTVLIEEAKEEGGGETMVEVPCLEAIEKGRVLYNTTRHNLQDEAERASDAGSDMYFGIW
jgi:hypothetical protein